MKTWIFCLLVTFTSDALTQDFFSLAHGRWEGDGELFGRPAKFTMRWESVFDGAFTKMEFSNQIIGFEKPFLATAYYQATSKSGIWVDSRGVTQNLTLTLNDKTLTVIWVSPEEKGKTTYSMLADGKMQVHDFVLKGDDWHSFGTALYSKQ